MTDVPHVPVLKDETLGFLQPGQGKRIIDGTFGFGGHSLAMLETGAEVLGLDLDVVAVETCRRISGDRHRLKCMQISFRRLDHAMAEVGWDRVDGVLLDLGVSSFQIDDPAKGFSYRADGPLDLRFNQEAGPTAAELLADGTEGEIADLIWKWGEERASRRIAKALVRARAEAPIDTTGRLREVIVSVLPRRMKPEPVLSRVFQALRIVVNEELDALSEVLAKLPGLLRPGGVFVVIAYHSLEDRLVKQFINREKRDCLCPPNLPACVCGHRRILKALTRKAVRASSAEEEANVRARSARLRAAEII
jgi:16S rRNA (cytosine1402-N4)-methyltransferase